MRTILLLSLMLPMGLSAQTLVSTAPQLRKGLLEEFTAINCGVCPQGHAVADGLLSANPGQLIVVAVHGGGLAVPSGSQPDFRTTWGTAIWSHFGVNAQPLGLMNRTPYNGQLVMGRTSWPGALAAQLALPAPVNIGAATQFDPATRMLTVQVETYRTAAGSGGNDRLHVLLTESGITGYQQDYQNGAQPNYTHQHVLRASISPLWGDELTANAQGALEQHGYTFTVPMDWNIAQCQVVVFVSEYQGEVYNAVEVPANGFSTGLQASAHDHGPLPYPQPASDRLYLGGVAASAPVPWAIHDLNGRLLVAGIAVANGDRLAIDISTLPQGMYALRLPDRAFRVLVTR